MPTKRQIKQKKKLRKIYSRAQQGGSCVQEWSMRQVEDVKLWGLN